MSNRTVSRLPFALAGAAIILAGAGFTLTGLSGSAQGQEASTLSQFVSQQDPPTFDQPVQVIDAFKVALAANDFDGLAKLIGLDVAMLKSSEGTMDTFTKMREGAAAKVTIDDRGEEQIIELGEDQWPFPFPVAKDDDGKWSFDTYAGIEEIVDRRVGENEEEAIATARHYVEAQLEYIGEDRDGDGVLEYAQKLISTDGMTDGLYWPAEQGSGESPAGALAEDQLEKARDDQGYYGYRFRILSGQGDNIAGGKHDYVINDNMIAGFALVAWPVTYAETGVHTFVVSKDGVVYEADLGPETDAKARAMTLFDPDQSWAIVGD